MFINPDLLKTAAILVVNGAPDSTIFFARLPITYDLNNSTSWGYAHYGITTRHSVENLDVSIRFNLKGYYRNPLDLSVKRRGTKDEPVNRADWIFVRDTDDYTDLAIVPIEFPLNDYEMEFIQPYQIVEGKNYLMSAEISPNQRQMSHRYGVGDEVFSIGLFYHQSTEQEAQSVVRFGHIAFQPADGEKILAKVYRDRNDLVAIDSYLVEMVAWPGQSGSPVFLRPWPREERSVNTPLWEMNFLVGMVQGFYPGEQDFTINGSPFTLPLNMNIGIVIPSKDIMDLLTREDVMQKGAQKLKSKHKLDLPK